MARIAHGLVVEVFDLAFERVAQGAEAARSVERLIFRAVQRERLDFFQRGHFAAAAVTDRFAGVAIFVDQSVRRPGEIVFERVVGEHRQGSHAHLDFPQLLELAREIVGHNRDEARRQSALRNEGGLGAMGELLDQPRGFDVFGQVEVMRPGPLGPFGDGGGERIGRRGEHDVVAFDFMGKFPRIADLNLAIRPLRRARAHLPGRSDAHSAGEAPPES